MKKVFICSPYSGDVLENMRKALAYCRQAAAQCFMPYAPHLYFTRFLDDNDPEQREAGIDAGLEWIADCEEVQVYGTPTDGMMVEISEAKRLGKKVVYCNARWKE